MPIDNRELILFTGENSSKLHTYSAALGHEYVIKYCGCALSSEMILRETTNKELVLVVIIWDFIKPETGFDIVGLIREYCRDIPIIVVASENTDESQIRWIQPDGFIREPSTPAQLREFVHMVHNVMSHHAVPA